MKTANKFWGNCPVCGKLLLWDDDRPQTAYCAAGHYSCDTKSFNQLWDTFDARVNKYGMNKATVAFSEQLLKDLRALNTIRGWQRLEAWIGQKQT